MKKILSLMLIALVATTFIFASGNKEESNDNKVTTINVATWDLSANPSVIDTVKAFNEQNPDIHVEIIDIASSDYTQKLSIMLNGGSDLDTFFVKDADTTKSLYDKGQIEVLNSYIEKDNFDLKEYNGLTKNFTFDNGNIAGLPARADWYVMYYNKGIFDKAGMDYPSNDWTWSDFEKMAKQLTSGSGPDKTYGALLHTWQAMVINWGVQDGKHTIMDSDYSFIKPYYEMALRMQNVDKSIMDYGTLKTGGIHYSSPFLTGKIGMLPMGTWFMTTLLDKVKTGESSVDWAVATLPHAENVPQGYTVGAATPLCINKASSKKDAAWRFVKFVTGSEGSQIYASVGAIPGRNNDSTLDLICDIEGMPETLKPALETTNISFDRPGVDKVAEINRMMGEVHSLIMLGESSIDDGIAEMELRNKEILQK
ncbi:MAG: sugar ABC transporter substrate-binding protein [Spirochaetia bacterium]|nr:sugar ABC transporter substrate-binding protein [Spirochaetia bacterium]